MKTQIVSLVCLLAVAFSVEAAPKDKRSVLVSGPVVATAPVVATVPVVRSVVHHNPTTVVKTEQVHAGDQTSYSYSTETRSAPAVVSTHTAAVAAGPAATVVSHTVPATYAYTNYGYYPSYAAYSSYYPYAAYSPYHYVVGK